MLRPCLALSVLVPAVTAALATAQPDPLGLQFVTVGSPGNPAYQSSNPNDFVNGRGAVDYSYRVGQYEVTTQQWSSFFNAAKDRPAGDSIPFVATPLIWGAVSTTPTNPGGQRWTVPNGNGMRPVGGIDWRTAAVFCNWLCHGANPSAPQSDFLNGAYDVSTFGYNGSIFTDQLTHTPGAACYIPSWDEWLKAAHWSPSNPNNNGWYQYSNSSDNPYVYGPPGVGQANAGFTSPNPFAIPLGSFPTVQSPWGLLDTAGGTQELTESVLTLSGGNRYRVLDGSYFSEETFYANGLDQMAGWAAEYPHVNLLQFGLRVASPVPSPSSCAVAGGMLTTLCARRRRR
jgi:formylglycine-generating enzyme required for sulfatase activity